MLRKQGGERPEMLVEEMADAILEFLRTRESVAVCEGMAFNRRLTVHDYESRWVKYIVCV